MGVPIAVWIAFFLFADLMLAWPRIDLIVSGVFLKPDAGFALKGQPFEQVLYWSINVLMVLIPCALILSWIRRRLSARTLAFLLGVLILVPGLVVNQVFKEHWGRPRPVQVIEFGGSRAFAPPFVPSREGGGSFCSGHVAAAAYLVVVATTLTGCRSPWVLAAILYTGLIAYIRIAAGGHFLSDVVTSIFLVPIGALMLHRLVFGREARCSLGLRHHQTRRG